MGDGGRLRRKVNYTAHPCRQPQEAGDQTKGKTKCSTCIEPQMSPATTTTIFFSEQVKKSEKLCVSDTGVRAYICG